ncbi:aminoglycoside phosphotransferase family protein [Salipaludibacillus sp. HK11]|uniref:aminoglycoside phosphotransferase family protein n=1 Tax=Salipaludibacillus sp. HK11 TaxID=3394320 RepID=UPI0039FD3F23
MHLQEQFVQSVRLYFKDDGEKWLQELPSLIAYCERNWKLKLKDPYHLSINYVAPATMEDNTEVVVKICLPGKEFTDELETLKLYNGRGTVKLIDSDTEKGILILEKITPGYTLAEENNDEKACRVAAKLLKKLVIPAPNHTKISPVNNREEKLRRLVINNPEGIGPISKEMMSKALNIFTYLTQTTSQVFLLHGDFHHYNILSSANENYKAIDPKGVIGELEYDLIQYMLNKLPEKGAYSVIEKRVNIFTNELKLNKERLLLWGYCHTVLATCWSVDDDGSYCKPFYGGITIFEELHKDIFGSK